MFWAGFVWETESVQAQEDKTQALPLSLFPSPKVPLPPFAKEDLPLAKLPAGVRDAVQRVLQQPTLCTRGPAEEFRGRSAVYHWLLDHPDQAARAWQQLRVPCRAITDEGGGRFGWTDSGSSVHWETVYRSQGLQIWYAEGRARPGPLLPAVPIRAVVVLRYADRRDRFGRTLIRHQADLFMQTDSNTAIVLVRLLGASAPRLAEQCAVQLQIFFSALVWYLDRYPDKAAMLLLARQNDER